ncbi:MAG TPA: DUF1800 domain-containing protein [Planctomycetota bacterium]|nr:DUF1800 domain-containing protein [Planctomycetota bacterium]
MTVTWNAANAAHLLRRAGFGATAKDVDKALKAGFEKTLAGLLKPQQGKFKRPKPVDELGELQCWWIARMLKSKHPLAEKLTLFWHNHFATSIAKVESPDLMVLHVGTLQQHALGKFQDLLLAVSRDPAMLVWLDNRSNFAGAINENYARELQELFTTGVLDKDGQPNYTELDVVEVARAFTGWTLFEHHFAFDASGHDFGTKTVKGVTGALDGTDVLAILAADPSTARRIPQKLWSFFAYPVALDDPLCDELAAVYVASDGRIRTILEHIFRHDAFYSDTAQRALVKSPVEFLVAALRLLGATLHGGYPSEIGDVLTELGQALFAPPSVFGWKEGDQWVGTSGLLARNTRGEWIADARGKNHPVKYAPSKLLGKTKEWAALDAPAVVARVLAALDTEASPSTVAALTAYLQADDAGQPQPLVVDADFVDGKLRGLISLVLGTPEFQLA